MDLCEDYNVILIEVLGRRHEGKFSEANFSPTQCCFSFFRVEKTFLTDLWSFENFSSLRRVLWSYENVSRRTFGK